MHIAVAAQFEKDSANLSDTIKGKIRCGFEAEFASRVNRHQFSFYLENKLPHFTGEILVSDSYGASHDSDYSQWSVEYDSSIPTEDSFREKIECVSPIQGLDETIRDLGIVFNLISMHGKTSQGTGLHMTFSLEDIDLFDWGFNPIKFLFLVGEDYYARLFGRQNYHYASEIITAALNQIARHNSTARITLADCSDALNAISKHYTERPTSGALVGTRYDNEYDDHTSGARIVSVALRSAMNELNRTNSLNMTKLRKHSCVEFRLPGGAGYENKFEQCSRLMRIIANALWASMAGKVDYNDYVAKKLFRYVTRAQAKATEGTEKPFVRLKSSEHVEGDSKVYQLTELSKFKGQTPQKTPLLTVTVKGNQITNITSTASEHTAIEDTPELEAFVDSLSITPAMALSVLSNRELCRRSPYLLDAACSRSLGVPVEAEPGSIDFDVLRQSMPRFIEAIESAGSIKRKAAKYVLLHIVMYRATAFSGENYVQELTDNEFLLNVGKLVKIAEPILERPTLLFFKFWVWAKLDKSLLTDDIAELYNTIALAPRMNHAWDQREQACIKLAERLANPRYRSLLPTFVGPLAEYRGSSMRDLVAYMFEQPVAYKSIREPATLAKFLVDYGIDGDFEAAYSSLGASGFKSLFSTMVTGVGSISPADSITSGSTSSRGAGQTLLNKLNTLDRVSSFTQSNARDALRSMLMSDITQHPDQPSAPVASTLRTMQNGIDKALAVDMSSLTDMLRTATDADLEPYKSDVAVAAGVTYSTAILFRAGVVCKYSSAFAKLYKSQPVWSAALLCLTAASNHYRFYEKNIPLFGLKPEAALRSMLQHFPGNARHVNMILSTFRPTRDRIMYSKFLDVASFLQQFPKLPIEQAFGKGMLDLFLQFAALKLSSAGPFGNKRSYYMFNRYSHELESLTGTLPPLLDYLVGQKAAGKDVVFGSKQSISIFNWKADSDGTEYSKSGPYFKYKVPKEAALGWLSHAQEEQPDAFDDSHVEESVTAGPDGDEATHKMAQFTNWEELTESDYQHFVATATVDDINGLFRTARPLPWKDQRQVLMDFLTQAKDSTNPNIWAALTTMLQSRMLDNMVGMLIKQQLSREICNNALFSSSLSDTMVMYGKSLPTLINSMLDMASGEYRVMWGIFNPADSYGYSDVLMVVSALPALFEKAPKTARLLLGNRLIASDIASASKKTMTSLSKEIAKRGSVAAWVLKCAVSIPFRNPVCDLVIRSMGYSEVSTQLSTLPSEAAPYPWRQALGV